MGAVNQGRDAYDGFPLIARYARAYALYRRIRHKRHRGNVGRGLARASAPEKPRITATLADTLAAETLAIIGLAGSWFASRAQIGHRIPWRAGAEGAAV